MSEHLSTYFIFYLIIMTLVGLCIGSFLNVVIYRLPAMMQQTWRLECLQFLQQKTDSMTPKFNLFTPRSHCPHCKNQIPNWTNIPLLGFLFLRGKCFFCKAKIAWRYPFVELITGLLTLYCAWHFGLSLHTLFIFILIWGLIAQFFIDLDHQFLPDSITLSLLWLGLLFSLGGYFTSVENAILGAVFGYGVLWIVAKLFYLVRRIEGMGHGDFKLFALFGSWLGWQALPSTLIIATVLGVIVGVFLMLFRGHHKHTPIAFGPFLIIGGLITLFWGPAINHWYLHLSF